MYKIGFIGLGVMGYWMASYLLKKYNQIVIYNRSKKKLSTFKNNHSKYSVLIAKSIPELSEQCNIIFTCVGDDKNLTEIYLSKNGILNNFYNNLFLIDHTTCSREISVEIFSKFKKKKCFFFDAPVSGGEVGAQNGQLSIMIGGDKKQFHKVLPFLKQYSKKISFIGKSGSGQVAKMCNQICIAGLIQGLSEGLNFAKKNNLEFEALIQAISSGAAQSWQMDNRAKTMWNNKFDFGFMNKHMYKDLKIIKSLSSKKKIPIPTTSQVMKFYKTMLENKMDDLDTSSLIKLLDKKLK